MMEKKGQNVPTMVRGFSMLESPQMIAAQKKPHTYDFLAALRKVKRLSSEKIQEVYNKYGIAVPDELTRMRYP